MEIEFDPDKDDANIQKHGISLARAVEFEIKGMRRVDATASGACSPSA